MWYTATSASVTNGATVVAVTTGDDISIIQEDSGLIFEGESPVQVKRGYIDGFGDKFIELSSPWPYTDKVAQPIVAYPTDASFAEATAELRRVIDTLEVASTVDMQAATNDTKIATPLKVKQAIDFHTGTAATRDVGESAGNIPDLATLNKYGYLNLNVLSAVLESEGGDANNTLRSGRYIGQPLVDSNLPLPIKAVNGRGVLEIVDVNSGYGYQTYTSYTEDEFWLRRTSPGDFGNWSRFYHTGNTTVDVNGFIKEASPIVRLHKDRIEEVMQPQGAIFERLSVGDYKITGTLGFSQNGWYIETPKDANGNIKFITEYSQDENGTLFIKTFNPVGIGWKPEKGEPVDITDGRWIDIRLEPRSNELEEDTQ